MDSEEIITEICGGFTGLWILEFRAQRFRNQV